MKLKPLFTALFLSTTLLGGPAMAEVTLTPMKGVESLNMTQQWDKIFPQSNQVEHHKVRFKNRFGITLVGDLYIPKNAKGKLPAIAVSGPFGAVKEQVSGLYAQTLAERGFITLAFDPSYTGESSGLPRNQASPEINTEDFIAAVDFLNAQENVQTDHVGILGICGFGGMALNAAVDTHIKAVATSTMYDMSRVLSKGYNDSMTAAERLKIKQDISDARQDLAKSGYAGTLPRGNITVDQITPDTPEFIANYSRFYTTKRGFHLRSVNSDPKGWWTNTTLQAFMNMPLLSYANEITAPTLIAVGENAHSRYFSEDAFNAVGAKDKQLLIIPNATHTDLYDNLQKIPFDAFADFFKKNL